MRPDRIEPKPGQESVWDYPRPPIAVASVEHVRVLDRGRLLADTRASVRVLETSQAPAYYLPREDVDMTVFEPSSTKTWCEWKGAATYWSLVLPNGAMLRDVAWSYTDPVERFASIRNHLAFYPHRVDECWVGDERVASNAGDFYGGWITSRIVGPFKGAADTRGW